MRDELVQALEEVGMVDRQIFLSKEYLDKKKSKKILTKRFSCLYMNWKKKIDAKTKKSKL